MAPSSSTPPTSTPILPPLDLPLPVFRCASCSTILTLQDELISRSFTGNRGTAFLVRSTVNTQCGPHSTKTLLTGKHTIGTLSCVCGVELGWTYFEVPSNEQGYKKGKSVIERDRIHKDNQWTL